MIDKVILIFWYVIAQIPAQYARDIDPTPYMHKVLHDAGVPRELWDEFLAVAACESGMDPTAVGDHGSAEGLFQIHWYVWGPWAHKNGYAKAYNPYDPVQNARVAYAIGEYYSLPRTGDRWSEWSVDPRWPVCQERAMTFLY